jgi:hypothetical protein
LTSLGRAFDAPCDRRRLDLRLDHGHADEKMRSIRTFGGATRFRRTALSNAKMPMATGKCAENGERATRRFTPSNIHRVSALFLLIFVTAGVRCR